MPSRTSCPARPAAKSPIPPKPSRACSDKERQRHAGSAVLAPAACRTPGDGRARVSRRRNKTAAAPAADPAPRSRGHAGVRDGDAAGAGVRLDKWLWAARFFKTRSLATEAIEAGRVRVQGDRPKPSKTLRIGEALEVRTPAGIFQLIVTALADRRGPASVAQALYREDADSRRVREELQALRRQEQFIRPWKGRPTKRERRALLRFTRVDGIPMFPDDNSDD
ncbi:MAG: RNA-binding S4 domain-containing protein [Pseudomonadota bacterium]|nr:RNA-binding S4 domain-containing protein [Pseudomonadota bacterium]